MDLFEIGLRLIGAFYVLAGVIATRAALASRTLDTALAAIAGGMPSRAERAASAWHLAGSTLVLASGLALLLLLDLAPALFVASAVAQGAYIGLVAPRWLDVVDPPDPKGRRQTTNAFLIYSAATGLVLWSAYQGRLAPLSQTAWPWLAAAGAGLLGHGVYVARALAWAPAREPAGATPLPVIDSAEIARRVTRLEVRAVRDCHPLWALDDGLYGDFPPLAIGLSEQLSRDLVDWVDELTARLGEAEAADRDVDASVWAAHSARGRILAQQLARERPDLTVCIADSHGQLVEVCA